MNRIANVFLGLGVAIGVVGVSALALGFRPSSLPAALIDLSVYKLVFIASGCVLAAGALVRRADRRRTTEQLKSVAARDTLLAGEGNGTSRSREETREPASRRR